MRHTIHEGTRTWFLAKKGSNSDSEIEEEVVKVVYNPPWIGSFLPNCEKKGYKFRT